MGCTEGFAAAAGWRLPVEIARKTRTARRAAPSAPTPALAVIDSRSPPPAEFLIARERYHVVAVAVNLFAWFARFERTRATRQRRGDARAQPAAIASAAARA